MQQHDQFDRNPLAFDTNSTLVRMSRLNFGFRSRCDFYLNKIIALGLCLDAHQTRIDIHSNFDEAEQIYLKATRFRRFQMLRRMQVKCRPGALGKGELCRTLVALDLACRALDCHLPRKTCVKLSGVPEDVYASALGTAQRYV